MVLITKAAKPKIRVTRNLRRRRLPTSWWYMIDFPRFPVSTPFAQFRYCTGTGLSKPFSWRTSSSLSWVTPWPPDCEET